MTAPQYTRARSKFLHAAARPGSLVVYVGVPVDHDEAECRDGNDREQDEQNEQDEHALAFLRTKSVSIAVMQTPRQTSRRKPAVCTSRWGSRHHRAKSEPPRVWGPPVSLAQTAMAADSSCVW